MAKQTKEPSVEDLIKIHTTPHDKEQAEEHKRLQPHIDDFIEHQHQDYFAKALTEGYKGSGIKRIVKGKDGKPKEEWRDMGLKDLFQVDLYQSHRDFIEGKIDTGAGDLEDTGFEHMVREAAKSLRNHAPAQSLLKKIEGSEAKGFYKGAAGAEEKKRHIFELATQGLYLDQKTIDTYKQTIQTKDKVAIRQSLGEIYKKLPQILVQGHADRLADRIGKTAHGMDLLKKRLYEVSPEDIKPATPGAYQSLSSMEMIQNYHTRKDQESYQKSLKKSLGK